MCLALQNSLEMLFTSRSTSTQECPRPSCGSYPMIQRGRPSMRRSCPQGGSESSLLHPGNLGRLVCRSLRGLPGPRCPWKLYLYEGEEASLTGSLWARRGSQSKVANSNVENVLLTRLQTEAELGPWRDRRGHRLWGR